VTASETAATLLAVFGCAFCGWLCLFRTSAVVGWLRANYARSRLVRAYPFSGLVLRPWYSTYLRCMGIFIWLFGVAFIRMVIVTTVRH
jgi:hypothetical protein